MKFVLRNELVASIEIHRERFDCIHDKRIRIHEFYACES